MELVSLMIFFSVTSHTLALNWRFEIIELVRSLEILFIQYTPCFCSWLVQIGFEGNLQPQNGDTRKFMNDFEHCHPSRQP